MLWEEIETERSGAEWDGVQRAAKPREVKKRHLKK